MSGHGRRKNGYLRRPWGYNDDVEERAMDLEEKARVVQVDTSMVRALGELLKVVNPIRVLRSDFILDYEKNDMVGAGRGKSNFQSSRNPWPPAMDSGFTATGTRTRKRRRRMRRPIEREGD